jgi:hypothetical protein
MLDTFHFGILSFRILYKKYNFVFFMGVKPGLSSRGGIWNWVFENSVLRRIFGPKEVEITGG